MNQNTYLGNRNTMTKINVTPNAMITFDISSREQYNWVCANVADAEFAGEHVVQYQQVDGDFVPVGRYRTGKCSVPRNQHNAVRMSEACLLFGIDIDAEIAQCVE